MLEVDRVDVHYGDVQALWNVSFGVSEGEIVSLIGSNGAGKTTALKAVSGILKLTRGSVRIGQVRADTLPAHRVVELGVSLVPEGRRLFRDLTVLENLELGSYLGKARPLKNENMKWIFEMFPVLESRARQSAGTLSGGEQQMLAIGRGLMSNPKLLSVDELSLGLAPLIVKNIYGTLKEINRSKRMTILIVEQNVRLALEVSNRGYVIENGRITGEGTGSDLLKSDQVKKAYLAMG
ncbi:MAG: ABC transporter ATP-binding protein [Thermodesulfobacteriota bacterium]